MVSMLKYFTTFQHVMNKRSKEMKKLLSKKHSLDKKIQKYHDKGKSFSKEVKELHDILGSKNDKESLIFYLNKFEKSIEFFESRKQTIFQTFDHENQRLHSKGMSSEDRQKLKKERNLLEKEFVAIVHLGARHKERISNFIEVYEKQAHELAKKDSFSFDTYESLLAKEKDIISQKVSVDSNAEYLHSLLRENSPLLKKTAKKTKSTKKMDKELSKEHIASTTVGLNRTALLTYKEATYTFFSITMAGLFFTIVGQFTSVFDHTGTAKFYLTAAGVGLSALTLAIKTGKHFKEWTKSLAHSSLFQM
ncbi:MAG: hypothetical protein ACQESC_03635 [Nanobdellota archaeon]